MVLSSDGSSIFFNHLSTQLLPGRILLSKSLTKRPKVKTRVVRRTLDPVYDEDFTFYGIHFNQLPVSFNYLNMFNFVGQQHCLKFDKFQEEQ